MWVASPLWLTSCPLLPPLRGLSLSFFLLGIFVSGSDPGRALSSAPIWGACVHQWAIKGLLVFSHKRLIHFESLKIGRLFFFFFLKVFNTARNIYCLSYLKPDKLFERIHIYLKELCGQKLAWLEARIQSLIGVLFKKRPIGSLCLILLLPWEHLRNFLLEPLLTIRSPALSTSLLVSMILLRIIWNFTGFFGKLEVSHWLL